MSIYIHKSHNVTILLFHLVFPTKYRQIVFDKKIDKELKNICLEIEKRYEFHFLEIGTDKDHVHFLVQTIPMWHVSKLVTTIKSLTARQIFKQVPEIKQKLWGASLWTSGYFAATVGKHNSEEAVLKYVKEQGREKEYISLHKSQLKLF